VVSVYRGRTLDDLDFFLVFAVVLIAVVELGAHAAVISLKSWARSAAVSMRTLRQREN
jgi:hypothetical protein